MSHRSTVAHDALSSMQPLRFMTPCVLKPTHPAVWLQQALSCARHVELLQLYPGVPEQAGLFATSQPSQSLAEYRVQFAEEADAMQIIIPKIGRAALAIICSGE